MSLRPVFSASSRLVTSPSLSAVTRVSRPCTSALSQSRRALSTITPKSPTSTPLPRPHRHSVASSSRPFSSSTRSLAPDDSRSETAPGIVITYVTLLLSWDQADNSELTSSQYEDISERDMEVLNESLEELCEDLGGGEWEVEYSVCTPSDAVTVNSWMT